MNRKLPKLLHISQSDEVLLSNSVAIDKENRMAIHLLAVASLPLSLVNTIAQLIVTGVSLCLLQSLWLLLYSIWMLFLDRFILPEEYPHSKALLYFLESPLMVLAILLGTFWDPTHQAMTVLLYLMALPVFILDRMDRLLIFYGGWTALFLVMNAFAKEPGLQYVDGVHVLEFFIAAVLVTNVVMRIRLSSLGHLSEAEYRIEHNSLSGSLNRNALRKRRELYLHTPLVLLFADMDQMKFYNDYYGHDAGNVMLRYYVRTLEECFGRENIYHYGGDEVLCIAKERSTDQVLRDVYRCLDRLRCFSYQNRKIPLSCTFGYVTGTPLSARQFDEMIRLADIYSHRAKKQGEERIFGGGFDEESLREGIIEANITARARAYEINQLTGLPGMSFFVARANELLDSVADPAATPTIGYFKIIQLRDFNNEFGYVQGDALIAYTAKLLQRVFEHRLVCHITGGQFCILCYLSEIEPAMDEVNDILQTYKPGFRMYSKSGFSAFKPGKDAITLLDEARIAQKSIKKSKNHFYRVYDEKLDEETRFGQYVVNHLDEAIEKGYLKVFYQPIIRSSSREVCNEEALSRWDDPVMGFLMPYRFIPVLEENALMYKLSLHVVRQVLKDFRTRMELGVPVVPVSINLSRKDFDQCDMVREITKLVDNAGLSRSLIKIEITESAFTADPEQLGRAVNGFHSAGFEVWLDDFGSEYSTLNLLQELDFDLIKLDMKFMKNFSVDSKNHIIISDIIHMTKCMGITTLIEGIETDEHYQILEKLGCDKMQGFLFNRPNPLDYITKRALSKTGLTFEKTGLQEISHT